jgi:hypothetical protein
MAAAADDRPRPLAILVNLAAIAVVLWFVCCWRVTF